MAEYVLNGVLLNGKAWLVETTATVVQPSQISVAQITAPAVSTPFTVHGSYANFTVNGLQYSSDSTNGTDGNWTTASVSLGSGTYAFTAIGLAAGTYSVWVRRADAIGVFAQSNSFTIAPSGGTGSLTQTASVIDSNRVFSRDVTTGNPTGFATTYNKGYAAVPFTLSSTAAGSLYLALYDANSSGATTTAGTGTQLQAPIAVASTGIGGQTVNLNIPAGPKMYYADFALDAGMTSALRIASPFGVGHLTLATGQSHANSFFDCYPYGAPISGLDNLTTYRPQDVIFAPSDWYSGAGYSAAGQLPGGMAPNTQLGFGASVKPPGANFWLYASPADSDGNTPLVSTFAPEYLSKLSTKLGVVCALMGFGHPGQTINGFFLPDTGTLTDNDNDGSLVFAILNHVNYKFDQFIWAQGDSDVNTTPGVYHALFTNFVNALRAVNSNFNLIASSRPLLRLSGDSNTTESVVETGIIRTVAPLTNAKWFPWCESDYKGDYAHPSWTSRVMSARSYYRLALNQLGLGNAGPKLVSASRTAGSKVIHLTVQQDTGTALVGHLFQQTGTTSLIENNTGTTSTGLAKLFQVYAPGTAYGGSQVALDATTPLTIVSATQIDLTLATLPADTVAYDVRYGFNYPGNGGDGVMMIRDNVTDGDGLNYGRMLQQRVEPLYVAPPTTVSPATAITNVNGLTSSFTAVTNAYTIASGTFAGVPFDSLTYSWDGGSTNHAAAIDVVNSGTWKAWNIIAPGSTGTASLTVTVSRSGSNQTSSAVSVSVVATDLPLASAALDLDARRQDLVFSNKARSIQTQAGGRVFGYTDPSTGGNHLQAPFSNAWIYNTGVVNGLPSFYSSVNTWESRYGPPPNYIQGLQTLTGSTLPSALRNASYTVFAVVHPPTSYSGGPFLAVENAWNAGSPQTLGLNISSDTGAVADRNFSDVSSVFVAENRNTQDVTRGFVIRFDVSTGTLKLMSQGGTEQTITSAGDYAAGTAWTTCDIGFGQVGNHMTSGTTFRGFIQRLAIWPGHYATDSERDALLAYGLRLYG